MPSALPDTQSLSDLIKTDDFISQILDNSNGNKNQLKRGSSVPSNTKNTRTLNDNSELIRTDDFIDQLLANGPNMRKVNVSRDDNQEADDFNPLPFNIMTGGNGGKKNSKNDSKIKVFGSRRMNLYSEFDNLSGGSEDNDSDNESHDSDDTNDASDDGGLSRQAKNQVDIIHDRTIEKIVEVMGVDKDVARNYKAVLYKKVKEDNEKLNRYERAIEMEKMATKEVLAKIDIKKKTEEIKKHLEEKALNKNTVSDSDKPSKTAKTTKTTKTKKSKAMSDSDLATESSLSATSDA